MPKREKKLTRAECVAVLNDNILGTLALSDGRQPYAVPLEYIYDAGALYMATYISGRKVDIMEKNDRAVFTVFEDRHRNPEMIKKKIRCRSVMVEGRISTIHIKAFTNRKGVTKSYRFLKLEAEEMGSWQCSRPVCNIVAGHDPKEMLTQWLAEARNSE